MKKVLSILLCLCMVASLIPTMALATDTPTYTEYHIISDVESEVEDALGDIAEVSKDSESGVVTIKFTAENIYGRIRFGLSDEDEDPEMTGKFVIDLGGATIDPGSRNGEAICFDNTFVGTATITGEGVIKKGKNNIIYCWYDDKVCFDVADGMEYFSLKTGTEDLYPATPKHIKAKYFNFRATWQGNSSLTLAQGTLERYTVTFDANGHGTAPDAISDAVELKTISAPTEPTADGYTFDGWFKEAECENEWDFEKDTVTANTTLYAKWIEVISPYKNYQILSHDVEHVTEVLGDFAEITEDGDDIVIKLTSDIDGRLHFGKNEYIFWDGDFILDLNGKKIETDDTYNAAIFLDTSFKGGFDIKGEGKIKGGADHLICVRSTELCFVIPDGFVLKVGGEVSNIRSILYNLNAEELEIINEGGNDGGDNEDDDTPVLGGTTYTFAYDCHRYPSFPSEDEEISLSYFSAPVKRVENGFSSSYNHYDNSEGEWTLTEVGPYSGFDPAEFEYSNLDDIVYMVASSYDLEESDIVVHKLTDINDELVAYGVLLGTAEDGAYAFFVGDSWDGEGAGYLLANEAVAEDSIDLTLDLVFVEDDDEGGDEGDDEGETPTPNPTPTRPHGPNTAITITKDENKQEEAEAEKPVEKKDAAEGFVDMNKSAWYYDDVNYVLESGIFKGVTANTFAPEANLTRAMLVTVLYRMENEPATNHSIPFGDIDMGGYYANAVSWGKQNGIVNGVSENNFAPNANITREQIAAIMFRYAQYKGMEAMTPEENLHFADADKLSEYAVSAMNWAVRKGLINGKTATTINPTDNVTRAETAAILHRFIESVK